MIFLLEFRNQLNIEHRKLSYRASFTQNLHDQDSDRVMHLCKAGFFSDNTKGCHEDLLWQNSKEIVYSRARQGNVMMSLWNVTFPQLLKALIGSYLALQLYFLTSKENGLGRRKSQGSSHP